MRSIRVAAIATSSLLVAVGPVGPIFTVRSIDMTSVKARKDAVSFKARTGVEASLKGMDRCTVYEWHALFQSAREVSVRDERLTAERIFINVGGRALVPDMPGVDRVDYLTNTSILDLEILPRHVVIVGRSYVGLEFTQMYGRFGSEVTIVHEDRGAARRLIGVVQADDSLPGPGVIGFANSREQQHADIVERKSCDQHEVSGLLVLHTPCIHVGDAGCLLAG